MNQTRKLLHRIYLIVADVDAFQVPQMAERSEATYFVGSQQKCADCRGDTSEESQLIVTPNMQALQ